MAKIPPKTLAEVRATLNDKVDEASDFLHDMETWKKDQTRFAHRVSAFLSAAESVLFMIEKHARRYARDHGSGDTFAVWYEAKMDAFRTPVAAYKAKKSSGSDAEWVYLRAARDNTIHIERTSLAHLLRLRATFTGRAYLTARLTITATNPETGAVTVSESETPPAPPPEPDETKGEKDLWLFKPVALVDQGGNITDVINPPTDDVVSICKRHLDKLRALVEECERELSTY